MSKCISAMVIFFCLRALMIAGCMDTKPHTSKDQVVHSQDSRTRVTLGPTRLRYFENDNVLTLTAEMASKPGGSYYIVYVPTSALWARTMPEWCRDRRDEILVDIKTLTKDERIKWVDED